LKSFFIFNIQKPKKVSYGTFVAEFPKLFSVRKTAMYGMITLLSVFMINLPTMLEHISAYATESDTILETNESSLVRIHFDTGSPVHPNLVFAHEQDGFLMLEERINMRLHFQYGQFESYSPEESIDRIVLNHGRV